jgi:hypothetical protein
LDKFDAAAFKKAGFPSWVRGRFSQIAEHEASHVAFLTSALGSEAVPACTYKLLVVLTAMSRDSSPYLPTLSSPYTDPKGFTALSMAIEGTGTSAYLGAAQYITNKAYLTAAGSILSTEARHDAWVASAVQKGAGWNLPYDTPLGFSGVYSIASQFITSCPPGYPSLPVKPLPALTLSSPTPAVGSQVTVSFTASAKFSPMYASQLIFQAMSLICSPSYLAYYTGLNTYFEEISGGKASVPVSLANTGAVYAAVVSNNTKTPSDGTMLSGLAILDFPFDSSLTQLT